MVERGGKKRKKADILIEYSREKEIRPGRGRRSGMGRQATQGAVQKRSWNTAPDSRVLVYRRVKQRGEKEGLMG